MNIEFPVNWRIQDLPITGFTLANIYKAIAENLVGTVDSTLLPSSSVPSSNDDFPLFDGDSWKVWNEAENVYTPARTVIGNVSLSADPSANRVQDIQDKDGTIALLEDTYNIRETKYLKEGLVLVDWDQSSKFVCVLSTNRQSAFYFANAKAGMEIKLLVVNNGSKQTVATWDSSVVWAGATPPSIPEASAGGASSTLVTFRDINGIIYGEYMNFGNHNVITDKSSATGLISS